jgi:hypothetical protein
LELEVPQEILSFLKTMNQPDAAIKTYLEEALKRVFMADLNSALDGSFWIFFSDQADKTLRSLVRSDALKDYLEPAYREKFGL